MNSKDAMRLACKDVGTKQVAENMGLSPTAIYNQINDADKVDLMQKFVEFNEACGNDIPIKWACEELNGCFVKNPDVIVKKGDFTQNCISDAVREFGDVLEEIGKAIDDGKITQSEAVDIRKEWEDLKRLLESFVLSSEFGYLDETVIVRGQEKES